MLIESLTYSLITMLILSIPVMILSDKAQFKYRDDKLRFCHDVSFARSYGYVIFTALLSVTFMLWMLYRIKSAAKILNVQFPYEYHSDSASTPFNLMMACNKETQGMYSIYLFLLLIGGMSFPILCSLNGLIWIIFRGTMFWKYAKRNWTQYNQNYYDMVPVGIMFACALSVAFHFTCHI